MVPDGWVWYPQHQYSAELPISLIFSPNISRFGLSSSIKIRFSTLLNSTTSSNWNDAVEAFSVILVTSATHLSNAVNFPMSAFTGTIISLRSDLERATQSTFI